MGQQVRNNTWLSINIATPSQRKTERGPAKPFQSDGVSAAALRFLRWRVRDVDGTTRFIPQTCWTSVQIHLHPQKIMAKADNSPPPRGGRKLSTYGLTRRPSKSSQGGALYFFLGLILLRFLYDFCLQKMCMSSQCQRLANLALKRNGRTHPGVPRCRPSRLPATTIRDAPTQKR